MTEELKALVQEARGQADAIHAQITAALGRIRRLRAAERPFQDALYSIEAAREALLSATTAQEAEAAVRQVDEAARLTTATARAVEKEI